MTINEKEDYRFTSCCFSPYSGNFFQYLTAQSCIRAVEWLGYDYGPRDDSGEQRKR